MKFTINIDGHEEELEVTRQQDRLRITRDGRTTEARVVYRDGPHFVLEYEEQVGDHVQRRRLRAAGYSDGDHRQLWVNGSNVYYERLRQGGAPAGTGAAAASLSAPIPAVVSEILVSPGEQVIAGQKLILLESMKMILPIQAPRDGEVTAIHCEAGEAVEAGVELIEMGEA